MNREACGTTVIVKGLPEDPLYLFCKPHEYDGDANNSA